MTGIVHSINEAKPHTAGPIRCGGCGHEWVGVVPIEELMAKCPECSMDKGLRKQYISPPDNTPTYRCLNCQTEDPEGKVTSNDAFILTPFYVMCCNCGNKHEWDEVAPGDGW